MAHMSDGKAGSEISRCPHGIEIGPQSAVADIESWGDQPEMVLEFYTACDCCDYLMHKDYANMEPPNGYKVYDDGRTLCSICQEENSHEATRQ